MNKLITIALVLMLASCKVHKHNKKETPRYRLEWVDLVTDTTQIDTNYFYRSHQ